MVSGAMELLVAAIGLAATQRMSVGFCWPPQRFAAVLAVRADFLPVGCVDGRNNNYQTYT